MFNRVKSKRGFDAAVLALLHEESSKKQSSGIGGFFSSIFKILFNIVVESCSLVIFALLSFLLWGISCYPILDADTCLTADQCTVGVILSVILYAIFTFAVPMAIPVKYYFSVSYLGLRWDVLKARLLYCFGFWFVYITVMFIWNLATPDKKEAVSSVLPFFGEVFDFIRDWFATH